MPLFLDNFDGSGPLVGHAPDVSLPGYPSLLWGTLSGALTISGGGVTGPAGGATAVLGGAGEITSGTGPQNVRVEFSITTPGTINISNSTPGFQITVYINDASWNMAVYCSGGDGYYVGDNLDAQLVVLLPNTTYDGFIEINGGGLTASFLGRSLSGPGYFPGARGFHQLRLKTDNLLTVNSVAIKDPNLVTGGFYGGLPAITFTGNGSGPAPIVQKQAELILAPAKAFGYSASRVSFSLPTLAAYAAGRDSTGEQTLYAALPKLNASARGGVYTRLMLPALSAQMAGTVRGLATANVSLPGLSTNASVSVSGMGSAAVSLPAFSTASYAGALCRITIGGVTAQVIGTTGAAGGAQIALPLFEASATATARNRGAANITLPSLSMGVTAHAPLTLPGLNLVAIGTAVVVPTYEAYAVNLKHSAAPGQEPPADETTRYTNYPFTHIVRYQNSYYGANSTGLYLLEGTTDDAAPIPWEFKTAITDFESPMAKTAVSAYFAGRMGPEATVGIHLGESGDVSYSHSTPRGPAAQNYRQVFGLGLKNRYYALSVAGEGVMELDAVEFNTKTLSRRI